MTTYATIVIKRAILDKTVAFLIVEEKRISFANSNFNSRRITTHWLSFCYNKDIR